MKKKTTVTYIKMTQVIELSAKDIKATIIKNGSISNYKLATNKKQNVSGRNRRHIEQNEVLELKNTEIKIKFSGWSQNQTRGGKGENP